MGIPFVLLLMGMLPFYLQASFQTLARHSETQNEVTIRGQNISYSATVGSIVLHDTEGNPTADMFYTEYMRRGIEDAREKGDEGIRAKSQNNNNHPGIEHDPFVRYPWIDEPLIHIPHDVRGRYQEKAVRC